MTVLDRVANVFQSNINHRLRTYFAFPARLQSPSHQALSAAQRIGREAMYPILPVDEYPPRVLVNRQTDCETTHAIDQPEFRCFAPVRREPLPRATKNGRCR